MPFSKTLLRPNLFVRRISALPVLRFLSATALLGALSGCQGIVSSPILSQLRIITVSPDAPGLDIYQGSTPLVYNLGFGTITSYVPIAPSTYTIAAKTSGSSQVLISAKGTVAATGQYTVLIGNSLASLQETIFKDQSQAAPSGQIALRFIDQATKFTTGFDVYLVPAGQILTTVTPLISNLTFGNPPGYLNIPTGTYTIVMVPTGTVPVSTTVATYTGAQITYAGGSARTIILIDQQLVTTPGLQLITAADYDSPTATI
ncbi:MAG: hypothetical protein JWM43_303 [Acidobacteriaceae bacterium]|nr:hypothetical protein [Acidobacteriaceae bacterium]